MKQETYFKTGPEHIPALNYCGTEICDPSFRIRPHIRSEFLVHYILSGKGRFSTPQKEYSLKAGDIFLIYPNQLVSYETDSCDPMHFSWFSFSGSGADEIVANLGFTEDNCVRHLHSKFSIQDKIMSCMELPNTLGVYNRFQLMAYLYDILALINESYLADKQVAKPPHSIAQEHVFRAVSFIKMNYMSPISISDVVNFAGLERSYFSKIFHTYTGKAPQEYLLDVRIDRAKYLLEHTTYSVREISSYVGFTDECYFSRIFRKKMCMPPKHYRTAALARENENLQENSL